MVSRKQQLINNFQQEDGKQTRDIYKDYTYGNPGENGIERGDVDYLAILTIASMLRKKNCW